MFLSIWKLHYILFEKKETNISIVEWIKIVSNKLDFFNSMARCSLSKHSEWNKALIDHCWTKHGPSEISSHFKVLFACHCSVFVWVRSKRVVKKTNVKRIQEQDWKSVQLSCCVTSATEKIRKFHSQSKFCDNLSIPSTESEIYETYYGK